MEPLSDPRAETVHVCREMRDVDVLVQAAVKGVAKEDVSVLLAKCAVFHHKHC